MGVIMVFGYIRECPNSEKLHTEVLRMFAVYSQMVQKKMSKQMWQYVNNWWFYVKELEMFILLFFLTFLRFKNCPTEEFWAKTKGTKSKSIINRREKTVLDV